MQDSCRPSIETRTLWVSWLTNDFYIRLLLRTMTIPSFITHDILPHHIIIVPLSGRVLLLLPTSTVYVPVFTAHS
jgi:hypothetical protein